MFDNDSRKKGKLVGAVYLMMTKGCKITSRTYAYIKQYGNRWIGRQHTEFERQQIRTAMTPPNSKNPRVWVYNNGIVKYIPKTNLDSFLNNGWKLGRVGYKPRKHHQGRTISIVG